MSEMPGLDSLFTPLVNAYEFCIFFHRLVVFVREKNHALYLIWGGKVSGEPLLCKMLWDYSQRCFGNLGIKLRVPASKACIPPALSIISPVQSLY